MSPSDFKVVLICLSFLGIVLVSVLALATQHLSRWAHCIAMLECYMLNCWYTTNILSCYCIFSEDEICLYSIDMPLVLFWMISSIFFYLQSFKHTALHCCPQQRVPAVWRPSLHLAGSSHDVLLLGCCPLWPSAAALLLSSSSGCVIFRYAYNSYHTLDLELQLQYLVVFYSVDGR